MPDQYSVISNLNLRESSRVTSQVSARPVETGLARLILQDRQFFVLGRYEQRIVTAISAPSTGLVVSGDWAADAKRTLLAAPLAQPVFTEPASLHRYRATAKQPFYIPAETTPSFFPPTLEGLLDDQRAARNAIAVTPTGQIGVKDPRVLKAALAGANALERDDVAFLVPIEAAFLSDEHSLRLLISVLNRSVHPVLLALVHDKNPLESPKRLKAYRRIFAETTGMVIPYRADATAFDARAHGAAGMAVGLIPSARRTNPVGSRGGPVADPTDMAPHVLIADLLRFTRAKMMRREWFVDSESPRCFCPGCRGAAIDRFYESTADRFQAHLHNAYELQRLHTSNLGFSTTERHDWWHAQAAGAADAYPKLASHIGRAVPVPDDVSLWSKACRS